METSTNSNAVVYKIEKTKDYALLHNQMFRVTNMSLSAKGLLCTMLQLPENWKYSLKGLASLSKDSETIVKKALNELIDLGYVTREKIKPSKENGGRYHMLYTIRERSTSDKLVISTRDVSNI